MTLLRIVLLTIALLVSAMAPAGAGVEQLGEEEFRKLAGELAPKVNLFRDAWAQNPEAEFYGGTTRDYLYWLKGNFRDAGTPAEAQKVAEKLRSLPVIDVKDFIFGESDVDILSKTPLGLNAESYGVRKIDTVSPALMDSSTELGFNERNQGHAPAEKVRLAQKGLVANHDLGDGVHEIYQGKLTVHFAPARQFEKTKYAREGLNHPVLLALRYVRLLASNYFRDHGAGVVDQEKLLNSLDEKSAENAKRVIREAQMTGELTPFLRDHRFRTWINGTIQKTFHSYSSPAAAHALMREFGVDKLVNRYSESIEPINQYLFAKKRDENIVAAALKKANVTAAEIYQPVTEAFPDGYLYHGTKSEKAFRGIIFQGALPSNSGSAGDGLYAVSARNLSFAENWASDRDLVVKIPVRPDAKVIDITRGKGADLWRAFPPKDVTLFADTYGADILRYPYESEAYVVKNSTALGRAQGLYRQLQSLSQIAESIRQAPSLEALHRMIPPGEEGQDVRALVAEEFSRRLQQEKDATKLIRLLRDPQLPEEFRPKIGRRLLSELPARNDLSLSLEVLASLKNPMDQKAQATAKKITVEPNALESLIRAESTTADQIQAILNFFLPERPTPAAMETVRKITQLHRPQYESVLAGYIFGYKAWHMADPDLTMAYLRKINNQEVFRDMIAWLDEGDFWQKHPDRLKDFLTSPDLPVTKKLAVFEKYLDVNPRAWKRHADLFDALLYPSGPFSSPQSDPNILKNLALSFGKQTFPKTAERLLGLDAAMHTHPQANQFWHDVNHRYFDSNSNWQNDPLVKKILKGESFGREALRWGWRSEQAERFGKEAKKKKLPPVEMLIALQEIGADFESTNKVIKRSGFSFADFLAAVDKSPDDDDIFVNLLIAGKPGPEQHAALRKIMQRSTPDMMQHLAEEVLFDPLWHDKYPALVEDFLSLPQSREITDAVTEKLERLGFWRKHPQIVKALARVGTDSAKQALLLRHISRNWSEHLELLRDFLPADDAPFEKANEALRSLNGALRARGIEKHPEILLELRRANKIHSFGWLADVDQHFFRGSPLLETPLVKELAAGNNREPWFLAEQWEKKRKVFFSGTTCENLFAKAAMNKK